MKNRKRTRHPSHNYSLAGYYFITICTKYHQQIFGDVHHSKVELNAIGKVIESKLTDTNKIYEDIKIDDYYIIMPNHIHFILILEETFGEDDDRAKMSVSKIVQQFKSVCTKEVRSKLNKDINLWQRSFYDRVIRNEKELYNIRRYIETNPAKWEIEKSIPENLEL